MRDADHAALVRSCVRLIVIGCGSYGLIRSYCRAFQSPKIYYLCPNDRLTDRDLLPALQLIERLLSIMPHKSLDSFFFANSGSEAVEAALNMVRGITRKQNIITMQGSFHGRTFGAMALTKSKTIYADGSAPLMVRPSPFRTCQPCLT